MDNNKNFKDNYKYNAKKILQIIEEDHSKQDNHTNAEIKQKKENEEYNMENINQAFSEVYDIINHLDKKLYKRIPIGFIQMIKEYKDNTYQPQIDYSKSINKQKLLKDTDIILSLIYRDYICSDEKREELKYNDIIQLKKEQEEKAIEFNYDDIFKKKKQDASINLNTEIVEYKENFFKKIIRFIKMKLRM